ncbi:MAG: hypothetical protein OEY10_07640 [Nitrosopumilus sp.]|nr:hypothetical protein [Nitrosopumilus sp.]
MFQAFKLLIPAIVPSWRFFDYISASPRVYYVLLDEQYKPLSDWTLFRPHPVRLGFLQMLQRMVWNPYWNESLFVVSCAERLLDYPTQHSEKQIIKRIIYDLCSIRDAAKSTASASHVQFRIDLVQRVNGELRQTVAYTANLQKLT